MAKQRSFSVPRAWQYVGLAVVGAVVLGLTVAALQPRTPTVTAQDRPALTAEDFATEAPTVPKVAFLGDSYTSGDGTNTDLTKRWTSLLADANGWIEVNAGCSGSGYANPGPLCPTNYEGRVAELAQTEPDVVIVSGGRNDYGLGGADYQAVVTSTFASIRAALPNATIIALNPLWDDEPTPVERLQPIAEAVRVGVEAVGGAYVDIGQPLAGNPALIVEDGIHPNADGYRAIADVAGAAIVPLVPAS